MSNTILFQMSFDLCPKNSSPKRISEKRDHKTSAALLTQSSFPFVSTSASKFMNEIKFLSSCEKLSNVFPCGGYRTRNRFLMARGTFARLISNGREIENTDVSKVSSVVSKGVVFCLLGEMFTDIDLEKE